MHRAVTMYEGQPLITICSYMSLMSIYNIHTVVTMYGGSTLSTTYIIYIETIVYRSKTLITVCPYQCVTCI
jgi:hypothetical protein